MYDPLRLRVIWNNQEPVTPFMGFRDLPINPEPYYPFGRKGLAFVSAWEQIGIPNDCIGMLILDGDVAIDPCDSREMHNSIYSDVDSVWVAPVRIWPVSHLGRNWVWGHGVGDFSQDDPDDPDVFSFSFTFLPGKLVNAMSAAGAEEWCYPSVDLQTWQLAKKLGITVKVARGCQPKHMHW